jgi:hypothetical protein
MYDQAFLCPIFNSLAVVLNTGASAGDKWSFVAPAPGRIGALCIVCASAVAITTGNVMALKVDTVEVATFTLGAWTPVIGQPYFFDPVLVSGVAPTFKKGATITVNHKTAISSGTINTTTIYPFLFFSNAGV